MKTKTNAAAENKKIAALKASLPEGTSMVDALRLLLNDQDAMKSVKEALREAGFKGSTTGPSETAEAKKRAVLDFAKSVGLDNHPDIGRIKALTVVQKTASSSESVYALFEVGGTATSCSVRRFVPHRENGGKGSEKLAKVVEITKLSVLNAALAAISAFAQSNGQIEEIVKIADK